ncbi:Kv channel-interacting protein 4 [Eurytemora carolleeae]|uniref:Kv channel-interacting protein 4 n=1 Tax=Eurytemora carolleeae TaxID=1294199 RepID=UPI000C78246D|nr:Kv channel-interacting protein 4 [Eurytemora carolleeae]|eukprot:XP_023325413.1 Kv channel-interacting protein 4-like [Eurytemora affinis]
MVENKHELQALKMEDMEDGSEPRKLKKKARRNYLVKMVTRLCRRKNTEEVQSKETVLELLQPPRYKPNDLGQISLETKFTKNEVKFLYRAFKTVCPNGIIDEETFKEVYEKIFPMGDASKYAQIVFRAIDRNRTGGITFGDFMQFLSVITKGTDYEKILWSFQFFDINQDGKITRDEMIKVSESVYELMGADIGEKGKRQYVDNVFTTMDLDKNGEVSIKEFVSYCSRSDHVVNSILVLV